MTNGKQQLRCGSCISKVVQWQRHHGRWWCRDLLFAVNCKLSLYYSVCRGALYLCSSHFWTSAVPSCQNWQYLWLKNHSLLQCCSVMYWPHCSSHFWGPPGVPFLPKMLTPWLHTEPCFLKHSGPMVVSQQQNFEGKTPPWLLCFWKTNGQQQLTGWCKLQQQRCTTSWQCRESDGYGIAVMAAGWQKLGVGVDWLFLDANHHGVVAVLQQPFLGWEHGALLPKTTIGNQQLTSSSHSIEVVVWQQCLVSTEWKCLQFCLLCCGKLQHYSAMAMLLLCHGMGVILLW